MALPCPDCGKPFGIERRPVDSVTGRRICSECRDGAVAAAAGVLANPRHPVAGANATRGWFRHRRDRGSTR